MSIKSKINLEVKTKSVENNDNYQLSSFKYKVLY